MGSVRLIIDQVSNLSERFAFEVDRVEAEAQSRGERARLAISGGSVASSFLPALAQRTASGDNLEIYFCDERAVPWDHPDSNFRAAQTLWFKTAKIPSSRIHPFATHLGVEDAAQLYETELRTRSTAPLDLALLGVGLDGHIASLFPGSNLLTSPRWVEPVSSAPKPPPERLTLTLAALTQASRLVVAAFGQAKAGILREALSPHSTLPLARLLQQAPHVELWLDPAAASQLPANWNDGCQQIK